MRPRTIRDIARLSGCSVATVSRVLNDYPHVRAPTRARVHAVIRQYRYEPHHAARALAASRTSILALILSDITNPFYPELARGVEDAAGEHGYRVILCNTDGRPEKEQGYVHSLLRGHADGFVFASARLADPLVGRLIRRGIPVVLANRRLYGVPVDAVVVDNVLGATRAVRHLLDHGHRRIAHLTGPRHVANAVERLRGYRKAMREAGLAVRREWVVETDMSRHSGYEAALRILSLRPRPTAIFAENDAAAIGVVGAALERGLRVPQDLAVVGFDNIDLAGAEVLGLTTVSQHAYEMGRQAARLLVARVRDGRRQPHREIVLDPTLVIRGSCGCPPGDQHGAAREA